MTLPCPLYNAVREIYLAKQSSCEEKTKMLIQRAGPHRELDHTWVVGGLAFCSGGLLGTNVPSQAEPS